MEEYKWSDTSKSSLSTKLASASFSLVNLSPTQNKMSNLNYSVKDFRMMMSWKKAF